MPTDDLIDLRLARRSVVHFEHDVRPGRDELRRVAGGELLPFNARVVLRKDVLRGHVAGRRQRWRLRRDAVESRRTTRRRVENAFRRVLHPGRSGRTDPRLHVMDDLRVAGSHFRGFHPYVLVEVRGDEHVLLIDDAGRRNVDVLRHGHDDVGLADRPALTEIDQSRLILRLTFRRTLFGPRRNRRDVVAAEDLLVLEMANARIREPRRHRLGHDSFRDGSRVRTRVLIGDKRHRRNGARPVALLTVFLKNRQNVPVERRGRGRRRRQ